MSTHNLKNEVNLLNLIEHIEIIIAIDRSMLSSATRFEVIGVEDLQWGFFFFFIFFVLFWGLEKGCDGGLRSWLPFFLKSKFIFIHLTPETQEGSPGSLHKSTITAHRVIFLKTVVVRESRIKLMERFY